MRKLTNIFLVKLWEIYWNILATSPQRGGAIYLCLRSLDQIGQILSLEILNIFNSNCIGMFHDVTDGAFNDGSRVKIWRNAGLLENRVLLIQYG